MFCFDKSNNIYNASIGFVMQRNHPMLPNVNRAIQNAMESGFINFWRRKYDERVTKTVITNSANIVVLKLENVLLAFGGIIGGWIGGGVCLILEIWLHLHVQQENRYALCVFIEKLINDDRYIGGFLPELPFFQIGEN